MVVLASILKQAEYHGKQFDKKHFSTASSVPALTFFDNVPWCRIITWSRLFNIPVYFSHSILLHKNRNLTKTMSFQHLIQYDNHLFAVVCVFHKTVFLSLFRHFLFNAARYIVSVLLFTKLNYFWYKTNLFLFSYLYLFMLYWCTCMHDYTYVKARVQCWVSSRITPTPHLIFLRLVLKYKRFEITCYFNEACVHWLDKTF